MRSIVPLAVAFLALSASAAHALPSLTPLSVAELTANCSVAKAVKGYEVEPSLASDPTGQIVAAAWQQDRTDGGNGGSAANGLAVSSDGGRTWRRSLVEGVSRCGGGSSARISDPWTTVGPDGTIYVASLAVDPNGVVVQASRDGGATWTQATVAEGGDKETITADPYVPGRAWIAWSSGGGASTARTDDYGVTWTVPERLFEIGGGQNFDIHLLPLSSGRLVAVNTEGDTGYGDTVNLVARISDDGGATWSREHVISEVNPVSLYTADNRLFRSDAVIFSAASAATHAWVAIQGADRVILFHSGDNARTWPRRVLARRHAGVGTPTIAVSPDSRSIAVSYLSLDRDKRKDRPVTARWRVLRSTDGGNTFGDTALTATFDARRARSSGPIFLGDYMGLTSLGDSGAFGALVVAAPPVGKRGRTDPVYAALR